MNDNALALIENKTGTDLIGVFQPNGLDQLIEKVRERAKSFKGDISTKAGRDEIRSFAANIGKDKAQLERIGKSSVEDLQKTVKIVTSERIRAVNALQEIQDEVRKPLTDWEEADEKRTSDHEADIVAIISMISFDNEPDSVQIQERIDGLKRFHNKDWEEFAVRAEAANNDVLKSLQSRLDTVLQREKEKAELERLRKEEAERKQREHEEKLKAEAAEKARNEAKEAARIAAEKEAERVRTEQEAAEKARLAAEAEAKKIADEEARKVALELEKAEQERQKLEREKQAEHDRAEKAEKDRIASEKKAAQDLIDAENIRIEQAKKAERDRVAAIAKAKEDARIAAEKAEKDKQAAIAMERERVAAAKKLEAAATAKREADKNHRAKINNEAVSDICKAQPDLTEADAKTLIIAIAKGEIRHIKIQY